MYFSVVPVKEEPKPFGKYHALMPDRKNQMFLSWLLGEQNKLQLLLIKVELHDCSQMIQNSQVLRIWFFCRCNQNEAF